MRPVVLDLNPAIQRSMAAHAASAYPDEACGWLYGGVASPRAGIVALMRAPNGLAGTARRTGFRLPPDEVDRAARLAGTLGLRLLGAYHSHPDAPPNPSDRDRHDLWEGFLTVIQEVHRGRPGRWRGFQARRSGVSPARNPFPRTAHRPRSTRARRDGARPEPTDPRGGSNRR